MHKVCPQCRNEFGADLETCPDDGSRLESPADVTDSLLGQLLADRYRVQRVLGEGGMGRVYLAEHERMGRLSAVKVMSPAMAATPEAISRFNREAANASRIHQPNVAAIYDFGETDDGTLYLAMEFVEGETLSSLLRREAPLHPARAAELTGQIADGLHAAHHLGIVHRDLKPDNVIVTKHLDGREWVKIVDFGIAKTVQKSDQTVTSLGVAIGTPDYMSPEQIAGENLDARTDLYSLGLVLFNMLTGVLPHPTMTSKQSLVQRLTTRPRSLAEVRPTIPWPPRLQKVLDRALAPEPDDRYTGVGDFARDVRAAVGIPVIAGAAGAPRPVVAPVVTSVATPAARAATPAPARKHGWGGALVATMLLLILGGVTLAVAPPAALRQLMLERGLRLGDAAPVAPHRADTSHVVTLASSAPAHDSAPPSSVAPPNGAPDSAHTTTDSLSPLDGAMRLRTAAIREARRADGDSTADISRPVAIQSAEADARDVLAGIKHARDMTHANQLAGAGMELRTAYQMYRIFLTEHAAAPQTESLRTELQTAMDEALAACHTASDAAKARGGHAFKCEHPAKSGILVGDDILPDAPAPSAVVQEP